MGINLLLLPVIRVALYEIPDVDHLQKRKKVEAVMKKLGSALVRRGDLQSGPSLLGRRRRSGTGSRQGVHDAAGESDCGLIS